jgi:hypothetical protein
MKARCKRRRSSEVLRAFLLKFHRETASPYHGCLCERSALLKACESFKEKALFCYRISAVPKEEPFTSLGRLPISISFTVLRAGPFGFWLIGKNRSLALLPPVLFSSESKPVTLPLPA